MVIQSSVLFNRSRTIFSLCLTLFSMLILTVAFVNKKNLFWSSVPWPAQMLILVLDIVLLGMLEGSQISLVATINHPHEAFRDSHPKAYRLCKFIHQGNMKLERYLMGRQIFVVICVFIAARLTTQDGLDNLFGAHIPDIFQAVLMQTGLLGVVVVTIFGQLVPQIIASAYPIEFIEVVPGFYNLCAFCCYFEQLGLVHLNYKVADFFVFLFRIKAKEESKDMLESAISDAMNAISTGNEQDSLRPKNKNKLESLIKVLDKISQQQNVDYESQIFQLAMQKFPDLFVSNPSIIGNRIFASPQHVASQLSSKGYDKVPGFLLPVSNINHVPPHILCCQLLAQNIAIMKKLSESGVAAPRLKYTDKDVAQIMQVLVDDEVLFRDAAR